MVSTNLSPHFTLQELTRTGTGLPNVPDEKSISRLTRLCVEVLEPLRTEFGGPIRINSGYRSLEVNERIGGARNSQHTKGEAADIVPSIPADKAMRIIWDLVQAGKLESLGQAILYPSGFLHISIDWTDPGRKQFLRSKARGGSGGPYLPWEPTV